MYGFASIRLCHASDFSPLLCSQEKCFFFVVGGKDCRDHLEFTQAFNSKHSDTNHLKKPWLKICLQEPKQWAVNVVCFFCGVSNLASAAKQHCFLTLWLTVLFLKWATAAKENAPAAIWRGKLFHPPILLLTCKKMNTEWVLTMRI